MTRIEPLGNGRSAAPSPVPPPRCHTRSPVRRSPRSNVRSTAKTRGIFRGESDPVGGGRGLSAGGGSVTGDHRQREQRQCEEDDTIPGARCDSSGEGRRFGSEHAEPGWVVIGIPRDQARRTLPLLVVQLRLFPRNGGEGAPERQAEARTTNSQAEACTTNAPRAAHVNPEARSMRRDTVGKTESRLQTVTFGGRG